MTLPGQVPAPQVWPTLRATDARGLIDFLVTAFGFVEVVAIPDGDGIAHAQLAWPEGGSVMLGSARRGQGADPWELPPGSFGGYVVTDSPGAVHDRAVAAGARITQPLHERHGSLDFTALDPEGNRWSFGTYRGEPLPV